MLNFNFIAHIVDLVILQNIRLERYTIDIDKNIT